MRWPSPFTWIPASHVLLGGHCSHLVNFWSSQEIAFHALRKIRTAEHQVSDSDSFEKKVTPAIRRPISPFNYRSNNQVKEPHYPLKRWWSSSKHSSLWLDSQASLHYKVLNKMPSKSCYFISHLRVAGIVPQLTLFDSVLPLQDLQTGQLLYIWRVILDSGLVTQQF